LFSCVAEYENGWSHRDPIAVIQLDLSIDALASEERTVLASQILQQRPVLSNENLCVMA
jgi:hypothetical protein